MTTVSPAPDLASEAAVLDEKARGWVARGAQAAARLAQIHSTAGAVLVDDESGDAASGLAAEIASLQATVRLSSQAAEEASRRALEIRRRAISVEADELQPQVAAAEARIEEHQAKALRLLRALETFTGITHLPAVWDTMFVEPRYEAVPGLCPSMQPLIDERDALQRQLRLLRAAAAGESLRAAVPDATFEDLPASLRPETGVLPAAGFRTPTVSDNARIAREAEGAVAQQRTLVDRIEDDRKQKSGTLERGRGMAADLKGERFKLDRLLERMHTYRGWAERDAQAAS